MSFVNNTLTGLTITSGISASFDLPFHVIQLNGEATVDKLRIVGYAMTDEEFDALSVTDVFSWDEYTLLYAEFTNNLKAGSIDNESVETWDIVRFCCGSNIPQVIATDLDISQRQIIDYTAVKGEDYYYKIYPITASAVIADVQTNTVLVDYDYYAFLDEVTGESFTFKLGIESGAIALNSSVSTYEGFTEYPAKSQGLIKYRSSNFSAYLGNVLSNEYFGDDAETNNALENFISNGNNKIMKDRKGNIRRVFTENFTSNIDEKPQEMPIIISFQWTEVGAV